jgi:hypothetical protein
MTYCCVRLEKGAPLRTTIPLSHYPHHAFIASFLVLAVQLPFQDDRFVALVSPVVSTRPHRSAWGWSLVCRFLPNDARICKQCRKYQNVGHPDGVDTDRTGICPSLQYYYAHPSVLLTCLPSLAWNTEESQPGLRSHALRLRRWCISGYLPPVGFPTENHQLTRSTNHRADDRVMPRTDGWA